MTINEYMNELALESLAVANEMACDSMLCDFYSSYADDDESSIANESIDLAFDDEDDAFTSSTEPATEAGFFKSLGNKFKSMLETVKGWFEKVAAAIKSWISKFVDRIRTKIANAKSKKQAMKIAGIDAENKATEADLKSRKDALEKEIQNTIDAYQKETNATKKQQLNNKIAHLKDQMEKLGVAAQKFDETKAIPAAKVYAQQVADGINKAEKAFKIACTDQDAIEKILLKIVNTKVSPKNKKSALVEDKIYGDNDAAAASALKKVKGAEGMRRDLEKMNDDLDKVKQNVEAGASAVSEAFKKFEDQCPSTEIKIRVLQKVNVKVPSAELTAKASFMAKQCQTYADTTERLAKLFGDAPAEGSDEKDKRPEIAKALSVYSAVANKLINIANAYLGIANRGEIAVIATEAGDINNNAVL